MTPPRNAHVFARLPTYEDFKKYRSTFVWLHRNGYKQGQDGYDAALQTRLEESSRYGDRPLPIPVHLIDFTRAQLDSVASTVSERLQQLGAPHTPEDAWASLQRDRAGAHTTRRRVSRSSTAASSVRQGDARSSPSSSSASSSSAPSPVLSSAMSSSSPATSSSLFSTSPASSTNLSPVQMDPARAHQQDVVTALTEMRELQRELDTARTRELESQAGNDATTRAQGLEASGSQLPNALAVRQQELDASRTRELELVASQVQLSEALQSAQSALHASQTQLQRLHGEMEAIRHTADGKIACLQQELDASRAQLDGAADAYRAQEQEVDELRRQLTDAGRVQQQAQARMQELRTELDTSRARQHDLLQRVSAAEHEIKCQEDSLNASVKVGYISRACQEFISRCPTWTQSTGVSLLNLSRQAALDMVNTFEEFDAVCSEPRREPVYLDSSSTAIKFNKARIALGLLLHPDKIAAKTVPHRQELFAIMATCCDRAKINDMEEQQVRAAAEAAQRTHDQEVAEEKSKHEQDERRRKMEEKGPRQHERPGETSASDSEVEEEGEEERWKRQRDADLQREKARINRERQQKRDSEEARRREAEAREAEDKRQRRLQEESRQWPAEQQRRRQAALHVERERNAGRHWQAERFAEAERVAALAWDTKWGLRRRPHSRSRSPLRRPPSPAQSRSRSPMRRPSSPRRTRSMHP